MAKMTIKLARQGDNVLSAEDYRLNFNSDWPVLTPLHSGIILSTAMSGATIVTHNLGYKPFFLTWRANTSIAGTTGPVAQQINDNNSNEIMVDSTKLYMRSRAPDPETALNTQHYYQLFNLSLDEDFTADNINPGKSGDGVSVDSRFAFKVTSQGDVTGKDSRNFTVDSDFQPLLVHRVVNHEKTVNVREVLTFSHNLGYPPNFFIFGRPTTQPTYGYRLLEIAPESSTGIIATADNTNISITITATFKFSLVILKDPIR